MASSRHILLAQRAATMRLQMTTTESLLWTRLSGSKLGVGFRRQFVIGERIADFAAPAARLVVEIDGEYHHDRVRADARRDRQLARLGWRVVRIPAALVLSDLDAAVAIVRAALAPA